MGYDIDFLTSGAGMVQLLEHYDNPETYLNCFTTSLCDDPRDTYCIKLGVDSMKKLKNHYCLVILLFIIIISIFSCTRNPMKNLPEGDFVQSLASPNGEYILNAYRYAGKMSFDAWSVRVEVVLNKSQERKNIYYKYKQYDIELEWESDDVVIVNGIKINILKDYYYKN